MIKDTGLDKVGGTVKYSQSGSGNWMSLFSSRLNVEMTTKSTNYASGQIDPTTQNLTFNNDELSAVLPPRITIEAMMPINDQTSKDLMKEILMLQRTLGVKYLKGGLGLLDVMPNNLVDGGDNVIAILVKNIVPREVVDNATTYIALTIQAEQIK